MRVELTRLNDAVHFEAVSEESNFPIHIDGSEKIGGEGLGARPMELILMALGGCSSLDVVSILQKMQQPIGDMRVQVDGEREPDVVPSPYTNIVVHYIVAPKPGQRLNPERVERAITLSMDKYCSVTRMLESSVNISWKVTIEQDNA